MGIGRVVVVSVLERNRVVVSGTAGAQPMLFAHGYGCDQQMWRYVTPSFEDFEVVCFDHVGAGGSDLAAYDPARYATLDGYATDVLEICDALELQDVVFVGHSVAAMIGVLAVNRQPERFAALVMVGPSPRYIDDHGYVGGFSAADIDELLTSLDSNYLGWSQAMAPVIVGNPDRPELGAELTDSFCRTDPTIARHFARATFLSDNRADLAQVKVPTLVLQCREDVIAPIEVGEFVRDHVPRRRARHPRCDGPLSQPERSGRDDRGHRGVRTSRTRHRPVTADDPFFDDAPCGFIATSADGLIQRVNRTFVEMCGLPAERLVGQRRLSTLLSVGGQIYVETHVAPLLLAAGQVRGIALELVTASGDRVPVLMNATLVRDDRDGPTGVRVAMFDATERREYERELLSAPSACGRVRSPGPAPRTGPPRGADPPGRPGDRRAPTGGRVSPGRG